MSYLIFTLFYILITGCIIYPPTEFVSAGLTIEAVFSSFLGSENAQFIQYHIKRSAVTLFVHSILPFCYGLGLLLCTKDGIFTIFEAHFLYQFMGIISMTLPLIALYYIYEWSMFGWKRHPISETLKRFSENNNWVSTAVSINWEFRGVDKICVEINAINKLVATDNWILKITPYTVQCAHQSDTALIVCRSDRHDISQHTHGEIQFIDIEVKSLRTGVEPFFIRLNALDFKDLQDRIASPITVLPSVTFHKSLLERFIDVFKEQISRNPVVNITTELDQCIGCMQAISNVKLQKNCDDVSTGDSACTTCRCRPMWCDDCMAKWFAFRQNESEINSWLSSKCTCPVCRSKFCILDVSYVEAAA